MRILAVIGALLFTIMLAGATFAQGTEGQGTSGQGTSGQGTSGQETAGQVTGEQGKTATDLIDQTKEAAGSVSQKAQDIGKKLNESDTVKEISAGLLQPIYDLAQYMAHPWFYWTAFAVMVAGVVGFVGQLVFTKLLLLLSFKLNLREVLSDALGLLISLTGLVLVTQAATQNSTFTSNAASVVSAAVVGFVVGFIFYLWGQKTEFQASRDKKATLNPPSKQDRRPTM